MHIMEGFLPPFWAAFWYLLSLPFIFLGIKKLENIIKQDQSKKLLLAMSGAFILVLSSLKLPSVTGSSSHPTGTGISAILFGFNVSSVLCTIVLIFQALLLAHGGITTLGADIFSMGIVGPAVATFSFNLLKKFKVNFLINVFIVSFLADIFTYITTSLQLALAYPGSNLFYSFVLFFSIFALTQIPLAIAESLLVYVFFDFILKSKPTILKGLI